MAYNRKTRPKMARNKYGFIRDKNVVTTSSLMESASSSSSSSSSSLSQFSATIWGNTLTHNSYITEGLALDYKSTDSTTPYSWFKSALFNGSYGIDLTSTYYTAALGYTHAFTLGPWKAYTSYVDGIHKSFMECNTIYTDLLTSSSSIIDADKNLRTHSIVPAITETYDLGSSSLLWQKLWAKAASISSLYTDNIVNEDTILTHNLEVTGSAHFAEIVIDKIKSTGGQFLLTPIDGFEVVAVDEDTTQYTLYFLQEKDGKAITNDWAVGDYALCKNFFGLKTGVSSQVSNQYYWREVLEASDTSIEIEGVLTPVYYIDISKTIGDGDSVPKVGDNVILCGHKYNSYDASAEWAKQRGSAIYFGTQKGLDYDNSTRNGLKPPFFAQYEGILYNGGDAEPSTYNLNPYRQSYFDATGAKFTGNFSVGGKDVKDYIDDKVSTASFSIAIMNVSTDNNKLTWKAVGYQTVDGERTLMSNDYEIGVILNQDTACEAGYYRESKGVWRQDDGSLVDSKGNAVTKLTFGIYSLDDGTTEGEKPYYTIEYLLSEDTAIMDLVPTRAEAWVQLNTDTSKLELYYYFLYTLTRVTETSSSPIAKSSTRKVYYKWQYVANDEYYYGPEWEMGEYDGDTSTAYATGQYEDYATEWAAGNAPVGAIIYYKEDGEIIVTKKIELTTEANTAFTINTVIGEVKSQILNKFGEYSTITQTAEDIKLAVDDLTDKEKATGIDIEKGKITLNAKNTIINGALQVDSANNAEGITLKKDGVPKVILKTEEIGSSNPTTYYEQSTENYITHKVTEYLGSVETLSESLVSGESITIKTNSVSLKTYNSETKEYEGTPTATTKSGVTYAWSMGIIVYINGVEDTRLSEGSSKTYTVDSSLIGKTLTIASYAKISAPTAEDFSWYSSSDIWRLFATAKVQRTLDNVTIIGTDGLESIQDATKFSLKESGAIIQKSDIHYATSGGGTTQGITLDLEGGLHKLETNDAGVTYKCTFNSRRIYSTRVASNLSSILQGSNGFAYDTLIYTNTSTDGELYLNIYPPVGFTLRCRAIGGRDLYVSPFAKGGTTNPSTIYTPSNGTATSRTKLGLDIWELTYIGDAKWIAGRMN